ncbi:MAG: ATP-binding cassette domain-containing protein [Myxococcota bacterium]|nr:ATP-binding cassette domain-containing protein [Myxococcota bacterium]
MLNATSVTKACGPVTALEGLSLSVAAGQLFCLLGANGAGKTTTINLFLGFRRSERGVRTMD